MVRSKTPFLWEGRTFVLPQRGQSLWCRMRPLFGRSTDFRKRDRGKHNRGSKSSKQLRFEFTRTSAAEFFDREDKGRVSSYQNKGHAARLAYTLLALHPLRLAQPDG